MESPPGPYAILRNRDFMFYLTGRFIASFGQQMLAVAVGWEIYERTRSSLALGLVGLTAFLPMVVMTLPAGHVADTRERKKVIVAMQAVLALTSLGLAVISWQQAPSYGCIFVSLVAGVARTFLWSASASFLPQLVARKEFPLAVTWSSSTFQFSAMSRPGGGRRVDRADPQRRLRLSLQRRGGCRLPGLDLPGARPPQTAAQGAVFDGNCSWRFPFCLQPPGHSGRDHAGFVRRPVRRGDRPAAHLCQGHPSRRAAGLGSAASRHARRLRPLRVPHGASPADATSRRVADLRRRGFWRWRRLGSVIRRPSGFRC